MKDFTVLLIALTVAFLSVLGILVVFLILRYKIAHNQFTIEFYGLVLAFIYLIILMIASARFIFF